RRRSRALAGDTTLGQRHVHFSRDAKGRLFERDVDRDFRVRTRLWPAAPMVVHAHTAKEHVKDVLDRAGAKGIALSSRIRPETVVVRSALGVRQDLVRLGYLFEVRLGFGINGIGVGVVLARQAPVRLLQLVWGTAGLDLEDLIQIGV